MARTPMESLPICRAVACYHFVQNFRICIYALSLCVVTRAYPLCIHDQQKFQDIENEEAKEEEEKEQNW